MKFLAAAILPLSVTATRTTLAGLIRIDAAEGHTVFFTAQLDNLQQFPIIPVTQRLTKCFASVRSFALFYVPEVFNHYQAEIVCRKVLFDDVMQRV